MSSTSQQIRIIIKYISKFSTVVGSPSHTYHIFSYINMVVRLRLQRLGLRNLPFYRIVAAGSFIYKLDLL
jgi:hypothetical protein